MAETPPETGPTGSTNERSGDPLSIRLHIGEIALAVNEWADPGSVLDITLNRLNKPASILLPTEAATAVVLLPLLGGDEAARHWPTQLELGDGVIVTATVKTGPTELDFGVAGSAYLGNSDTLPVIGEVGGNFKIGTVVIPNGENLAAITASASDPSKIQAAFVHGAEVHALAGVSLGLIVAMGGAIWLVSSNRRVTRQVARRQAVSELSKAVDMKDDASTDNPLVAAAVRVVTQHEEKHPERKRLLRRTIAAAVAGGLLFSGAMTLRNDLRQEPVPAAAEPLDAAVTAYLPSTFTGIRVIGTVAKTIFATINDNKNKVDSGYQILAYNLSKGIDQFVAEHGLGYQNNPNIVAIIVTSDAHGNLKYFQDILPIIIKKLDVPLIVDAGDTDISGDKLPLENEILTSFAGMLQILAEQGYDVHVVLGLGNHDSAKTNAQAANLTATDSLGKSYPLFLTFNQDNNFTVHVNGLTFVSKPDPRVSTSGTLIQPQDPIAQKLLLAEQGDQINDIACRLAARGTRPIVIAHDAQALAASLFNGCGSGISGHYHDQKLPRNYRTISGGQAQLFEQGSSSGAAQNANTIYNLPGIDGPTTILFFNKTTRLPTGYLDKRGRLITAINLTNHGNLTASVTAVEGTPATVTLQMDLLDFLNKYSRRYFPPSKSPDRTK